MTNPDLLQYSIKVIEKISKIHNEVVGRSTTVYGRTIQYSDNNGDEAVLESGGMFFQVFVFSVQRAQRIGK